MVSELRLILNRFAPDHCFDVTRMRMRASSSSMIPLGSKMTSSRFDNHDRERVIEATDLVALIGEHLEVRQKGREHICVCPFHDDSKPSLTIVTHRDRPFYHCFACQAHGDSISFMMEYHKMSFPEALRALADRAGIVLQESPATREKTSRRSDLLRATDAAAKWFRKHLVDDDSGKIGRTILADRGISPEIAETFMLGIAPDDWEGLGSKVQELERHARNGDRTAIPFDAFIEAALLKPRREGKGYYDVFRNRLIFPICDEMGRPIAFGARRLHPEDEPKYLNSPESSLFDKSKTLYALNLARKSIIDEGHAIVVEGYTDAIACHQAGITNVVATLGTALTKEHAKRLQRICGKVTLLFDGDTAGARAADRAAEVFFDSEIDVRICSLAEGVDPDELLQSDNGRASFDALLDDSMDILEHLTTAFRKSFRAAEGISARQQVIRTLMDRLASLGFNQASGMRKHLVLDAISSITGMPESDLSLELNRRRRKRPAPQARSEPAPPSSPPAFEESVAPDALIEEPVSLRRREAERRVLALFINSPELATTPVDAGEGMMLPASELFPGEQFTVPVHRRLADVLVPAIESGERPSVDQLLLSVEHRETAILVAELFRYGAEMITNADCTEPELLARICEDLASTDRMERFATERQTAAAGASSMNLTHELERLRQRGSDRSVLPQVERPKKPMSPPLMKKNNRRSRR